MKQTPPSIAIILFLSLIFFAGAVAATAQDAGEANPEGASPESLVDLDLPRRALLVGNSDYDAGPLANPVNDARDMAGVLEKAGFEVMLRVDRSLEEMEEDLRDFAGEIEEGETALLFYAGHGVQVDGENYLLPVNNEGIEGNMELRRRAVRAGDYIKMMNEAGSGINIVMLDACRDNPLPAESRGGARGLSVMSAPWGSETVIVFATKAGQVAQDGEGENSTFTKAFLETVEEPDLDIMNLFNKVGARVRESTGGAQVPTIYSEPLSKSFSFFSSKRMAERAQRASEEAQTELKTLEEEIAARQRQIEQAEDEAERRRLELEQQKREAKLAARRLEAQNLEREAQRRAEEAAAAEEAARRLAEERSRAAEQQQQLEKLAAARREELLSLKKDVQSSDPDVLIETIERLEMVIEEVEGEYEDAWLTTRGEIRESFEPRFAALKDHEPEIWESDAEFEQRIESKRRKIEHERSEELKNRKAAMEAEEVRQTASIRTQLQDTIDTLDRQTWTLEGSDVSLEVGEYDRNERTWLFTVSSNVDEVPVPEWHLVKDFSYSNNLKEELVALDKAVKAGGLTAKIEWKIDRREIENSYYGAYGSYEKEHRYYVVLRSIVIKDLTRNETIQWKWINEDIAYFRGTNRNQLTSEWKQIKITSSGPYYTIYTDDKFKLGKPPVLIYALKGSNYRVKVVNDENKDADPIEKILEITNGQDTYDVYDFDIGDEGPAGGIVYYDRGYYMNGWRYLELAPKHTEWEEKVWGGRGREVGGLKTYIGAGEENTKKIVDTFGHREPNGWSTDYAAKLCADLEYGGYEDWFLPSKNEQEKIYENLVKRGIGNFSSTNYWRSSEKNEEMAWSINFDSGSDGSYYKDSTKCVRASRAF